ncbi:hypothetical protein CRG98_000697 [Punica granatum]|uniref:Uncharacterized protein n=1 Tax=Punica granatum TaxID=22663 RepID=A0A2I0LE13_PUNGR|nr:hypothetical protein CRG98_000697 [Punica granatum]
MEPRRNLRTVIRPQLRLPSTPPPLPPAAHFCVTILTTSSSPSRPPTSPHTVTPTSYTATSEFSRINFLLILELSPTTTSLYSSSSRLPWDGDGVSLSPGRLLKRSSIKVITSLNKEQFDVYKDQTVVYEDEIDEYQGSN